MTTSCTVSDNAKLAHALVLSGRATGQVPVFERGLQALRWLVEVQTAESGDFRPIGSNGFFPRGGPRATSDVWWYEQAQRSFDWFLGWNDLGLELYSSTTGGCRDALHVDRVNQNQGAESTLAFLLSLAEMRLMQNSVSMFNPPHLPGLESFIGQPPSAIGDTREALMNRVH